MKRKTKRFNGESESVVKDFASTGPDVEDLKKGIFSGAAAPDESDTYALKTRKFTTVSPDKPKPRPAAPKVKTGSGASGFGLKEKEMESASSVMKRGQAGSSDSGRNPSLDRLMSDREATASREARRRSAMVDKANAGVPESGTKSDAVSKQFSDAASQREGDAIERRNRGRLLDKMDVLGKVIGHKKGGKTASARADGIAQRGKTRA